MIATHCIKVCFGWRNKNAKKITTLWAKRQIKRNSLIYKFETSVQPVFFYRAWNYLLLDNGRVLHGSAMWDSLDDFKANVIERYDAEKFTPFITECEQYLKTINHVQ